jgi:hypothetical protein
MKALASFYRCRLAGDCSMESSPRALAQPIAVPIEARQQVIIETLLEFMPESLLPHDLQVVPVFDRQSHRYQLLC